MGQIFFSIISYIHILENPGLVYENSLSIDIFRFKFAAPIDQVDQCIHLIAPCLNYSFNKAKLDTLCFVHIKGKFIYCFDQ